MQGRDRDLWILARARSTAGGKSMASLAAVEIESRPEAFIRFSGGKRPLFSENRIDCVERLLRNIERT